jgi:hypothetical protein
VQLGMSALPPKAAMCGALAHVCLGPEADIATAEHMIIVGPCDNRLGALLTVSERVICPVANGAVEIALAERDHFGTAVTSTLILLPRRRHFGIGSSHIAHASYTLPGP